MLIKPQLVQSRGGGKKRGTPELKKKSQKVVASTSLLGNAGPTGGAEKSRFSSRKRTRRGKRKGTELCEGLKRASATPGE